LSFIDIARKFAFIHVSKTSSVIEWTWRAACGVRIAVDESRLFRGGLWLGGAHDCARDTRRLQPELWAQSFKVGFVRNPWAWWVSAYFWYNPPRHTGFDFLARYPTFREFLLRWKEWRLKFPWDGYTGFLCDDDGKIMVDYVGRSERLQQDFDMICDRVGFPKTTLPRKTDRRNYREFYDGDDLKRIVYHLSGRDIDLFGYTFDDGGDC